MALYAFDGTGNEARDNLELDGKNTNVRSFFRAYDKANSRLNNFYVAGVGTRFSVLGAVFGGALGIGGKSRIDEATERLAKNIERGDRTIDVIGFSRGSALALEFTHEVRDRDEFKGANLSVRFLGLWDTVGSFGLPGNNVNLGYSLTVPPYVDNCFHALALDERRMTFPLTRMVQDDFSNGGSRVNIDEVWFRGFHSDVGGGNENPALSNVALRWMLCRATKLGLEIDDDWLSKVDAGCKPSADGKKPRMDRVENKKRTIQKTDQVHVSVDRRELADGIAANNPPRGLQVAYDGDTAPTRFEM